MSKFLFNFIQQFELFGVLAAETGSHSGKTGENGPGVRPWVSRQHEWA